MGDNIIFYNKATSVYRLRSVKRSFELDIPDSCKSTLLLTCTIVKNHMIDLFPGYGILMFTSGNFG